MDQTDSPSVLFPYSASTVINPLETPEFFTDLNLDQVVEAITRQKQEYELEAYFYSPLHTMDAIQDRQTVFKDLEDPTVLTIIQAFAEKMILVHRYLGMIKKQYYRYHQEGWFLEVALLYCEAIQSLTHNLAAAPLKSKGLTDFLTYAKDYINSADFITLQTDSIDRKKELSAIQYSVIIKGTWVRVQNYDGEIDYSQEVNRTFEKFKQGEVKNYRIDRVVASGMNHVEAQILDCVAKLNPRVFKELENFYLKHNGFLDPVILTFDRQIQFFVAYLEFIEPLKRKGLPFCYPRMTAEKDIQAETTFDIALANKRLSDSTPIVCNDFSLGGKERLLVVSGPNQGGKTTFARMFGQLHYLACLGCPVPGKQATLFLFDHIFTHFENEEDLRNLRGKLQDDLVRIHMILERATSSSIIIMNEIFTSTALQDAVFLSQEVVKRMLALDAIGVCVTFIDELSTLGEQTVSMVSTIVPGHPSERTYKILRKPADGLSYALSIAEKHRLSEAMIRERISQ